MFSLHFYPLWCPALRRDSIKVDEQLRKQTNPEPLPRFAPCLHVLPSVAQGASLVPESGPSLCL